MSEQIHLTLREVQLKTWNSSLPAAQDQCKGSTSNFTEKQARKLNEAQEQPKALMPRTRFLNYRSPLRPASLPPSGLALHSPQANQTQSLPSPAASKPKGCRSVQSAANPSAHGLPPNPTRQGPGGALRPISGPRRCHPRCRREYAHLRDLPRCGDPPIAISTH